jgi:hypothetical protein
MGRNIVKTKIRIAALVFVALSVAYYVWVALAGGSAGWGSDAMVWPICAVSVAISVFAFSGDGIMQTLTGKNSAAFRDALIGIGTVTAVRPTGTTINDQPQVRIDFSVEGADGKVFQSSAKMIVPLTEMAMLQPGAVLPVRYLADRTDKVEVDRSGNAAQFQEVYDQAMIRKGVTTQAKLDIAKRGVAAKAVVQTLSVTGEIRDGNSKLDVGLVVTRPDGSTFTTRVERFVPPGSIALVQVGRVIDVRYMAEDEREVIIALPVNA